MFSEYLDKSKIWVYQSSKAFTPDESIAIQQKISDFAETWNSHKLQLKAAAKLIYNQFIVFLVEENTFEMSGCSVDTSINFIKQLEKDYNVNFLNRMEVAYRDKNNSIVICLLSDLEKLAEENKINSKTIVFNNLISTKKELLNNWEITIENSWHKNYLPQHV